MTRPTFHPTSPFPFRINRLDGTAVNVVDERCVCGCFRSGHRDTDAFGHGACTGTQHDPRGDDGPCLCEQFTWSSWVFADDVPKAAGKPKRRRGRR